MNERFDRVRFAEYISDPFYIAEILGIISAAVIMDSSIAGIHRSEVSFSDGLVIMQILFILYSSLVSYYYTYRIERGIMGYIFTMPVNRYSFLGVTFLFENLVPAILIMLSISLVMALAYFSIMLYYITFLFLLTISELCLMTAIGRLLGTIIRNGILTFVLLFGLFYSLNYISLYFPKGGFLWLIAYGIEALDFIKPSIYFTWLIMAILVASFFIYQASFFILKQINLKSGR
ncbi:hypothetical protein ACNF42_03955 [Cuniculiplasma sp. SKW3]|uniref:hypothetical protein n=1 Tax=Cuniculiplasma sp. SKW3 TaxID=3400170 RepID=UPI003FD2436A